MMNAAPTGRRVDESDVLRVGLVGTGYWAQQTHAPGIAAAPGARLAAVWGRSLDSARVLAGGYGAAAYEDYDDFLEQVDAVCFSVPPDVQGRLAALAARSGKHLLLEKPVALDRAGCDELISAVGEHDVAALVFLTHLFSPPARAWFAEVAGTGGWFGGEALWLGSALRDANPFNTPWRRRYGGLWDVGPHAVAGLWRTLGPVTAVSADRGERDLTYLVLHHEGGATSSATLTLNAPDAADGFSLQLWGEHGRSALPIDEVDSRAAASVAVGELAGLVASGRREHPSDLAFGVAVVDVLATAQRLLTGAAPAGLVTRSQV